MVSDFNHTLFWFTNYRKLDRIQKFAQFLLYLHNVLPSYFFSFFGMPKW